MSKYHELKIDTQPFFDVVRGVKTAEFRKNDREFAVGDCLMLKEFSAGAPTGYQTAVYVTHIQTGYGIPEGYVMMSIKLQSLLG